MSSVEKNKSIKLHIWCWRNILKWWLNTDISNQNNLDIYHLDATKKFPFKNDTFEYIFSEHMIEHISYDSGLNMLKESYRVLNKNGKIRIVTPDLLFLFKLMKRKKTNKELEYIKWSSDTFLNTPHYYDEIFIINNFFRDWGHTFIYDQKTLIKSLELSWFKNISKEKIYQSSDINFLNLENKYRMPDGFLEIESMVFEAQKI